MKSLLTKNILLALGIDLLLFIDLFAFVGVSKRPDLFPFVLTACVFITLLVDIGLFLSDVKMNRNGQLWVDTFGTYSMVYFYAQYLFTFFTFDDINVSKYVLLSAGIFFLYSFSLSIALGGREKLSSINPDDSIDPVLVKIGGDGKKRASMKYRISPEMKELLHAQMHQKSIHGKFSPLQENLPAEISLTQKLSTLHNQLMALHHETEDEMFLRSYEKLDQMTTKMSTAIANMNEENPQLIELENDLTITLDDLIKFFQTHKNSLRPNESSNPSADIEKIAPLLDKEKELL